jgi:hypothetical protein
MPLKERKLKTKDGLPAEAFAIVGDPFDPETWQLPHHTRAVFRALTGRFDIERTVDWDGLNAAVAALSPRNRGEHRIEADPEAVIAAARHLATHYQKDGKALPDILAALV